MSYQVLARKWRPRRFADLVGQAHVVRALSNALDHDRLHHAFLFTGTRGVGKTTIARILAKSLNCEVGVSSLPCGECATCREVDEGRFVDLIEVDAASRTKVDDTRELLDNVQYAPTRGRYKVYLIDEVHMLSGHSFNALLKTLEEPPPHVKFLLATTDPQKLPVTVLSRCLQFNLKRLQPEQIAGQLDKVLKLEDIAHDSESLALLARSADGSMRDALSLLDQAIAFGNGQVAASEVRDMLGTIDNSIIQKILDGLAGDDASALIAAVAEVAERSPDYDSLLGELLLALYRISLAQLAPQAIDDAAPDRAWAMAYAARLTPEDVQLYYQIGLLGRRDLPLSPDARTGVEMVLLRMLAFRPGATTVAVSGAKPARPEPAADPGPVRVTPAPAPASASAAPPAKPSPARSAVPTPSAAPAATPMDDIAVSDWTRIVSQLGLAGLMRELANNTSLDRQEGDVLYLTLDASCGHLLSKEREAGFAQALARHYGHSVTLRIRVGEPSAETPTRERQRNQDERQQAAEAAVAADPAVQLLQETFNARVSPGSVRPKY